MISTGYFVGTMNHGDEVIISFSVPADTELGNLDGELDITAERIREKRSLQANKYLWKLCSEMGHKLNQDRIFVYKRMLFVYGIWSDYRLSVDAYPTLFRTQKYLEILEMDDEWMDVRVYLGSSTYDKREFGELLSGVISEARELGINTWSDEEFNYLMENWDGK